MLEVKGRRAVERGDGGRRVGQHGPVQEVSDGDGQHGQQLELDVRLPASKQDKEYFNVNVNVIANIIVKSCFVFSMIIVTQIERTGFVEVL